MRRWKCVEGAPIQNDRAPRHITVAGPERCTVDNDKRPMTPLDWALLVLPVLLILLLVLALV